MPLIIIASGAVAAGLFRRLEQRRHPGAQLIEQRRLVVIGTNKVQVPGGADARDVETVLRAVLYSNP
jgi:hypothetical protein